jgi:membrane associated rhomboid family serine protease
MLEDRSYMREDSFGSHRPFWFILMLGLVATFFVQKILEFYVGLDLVQKLGLSLDGLKHGYLWQLVSFQFLHAGLLHLLFNCLGLYFFGRSVEETLGSKGFLKLYFLSGLLGGLVQILANLILGHAHGAVLGASAGVLGLLAAFCLLFPDRDIYFWFVIRIRAIWVLWITIFLSVYGTVIPFDTVAHAAHLGGIFGGFAYLRWGAITEKLFVRRRRVRSRPRELIKVPKGAPWQRHKSEGEELPPGEFISREVDPILDKISAHGIQSLTPRERKILEAARAKMEKR